MSVKCEHKIPNYLCNKCCPDEITVFRARVEQLETAIRKIQAHVEAGGANEELTAATILCSEALRR